jgi:hypothetical protein
MPGHFKTELLTKFGTSNHALEPVQNHARAFRPPAERIQQPDTRRQQRNSKQQHAGVAEKNDDGGKQTALARDVRLPRLQGVKRQRHVKRIRRADAQMKPDKKAAPVPNQIAQREQADDDDRVSREKMRRERYEKIGFGNDNVAAGRRDLHFFDLPAEQPCPERVGQFVAEDINPHRLGQQKENHEPARRPGEQRDPDRVRAVARAQHQPQCLCCAGANRQQQNGNDKLDPLRHAARIQNLEFRSQTKPPIYAD